MLIYRTVQKKTKEGRKRFSGSEDVLFVQMVPILSGGVEIGMHTVNKSAKIKTIPRPGNVSRFQFLNLINSSAS